MSLKVHAKFVFAHVGEEVTVVDLVSHGGDLYYVRKNGEPLPRETRFMVPLDEARRVYADVLTKLLYTGESC